MSETMDRREINNFRAWIKSQVEMVPPNKFDYLTETEKAKVMNELLLRWNKLKQEKKL